MSWPLDEWKALLAHVSADDIHPIDSPIPSAKVLGHLAQRRSWMLTVNIRKGDVVDRRGHEILRRGLAIMRSLLKTDWKAAITGDPDKVYGNPLAWIPKFGMVSILRIPDKVRRG